MNYQITTHDPICNHTGSSLEELAEEYILKTEWISCADSMVIRRFVREFLSAAPDTGLEPTNSPVPSNDTGAADFEYWKTMAYNRLQTINGCSKIITELEAENAGLKDQLNEQIKLSERLEGDLNREVSLRSIEVGKLEKQLAADEAEVGRLRFGLESRNVNLQLDTENRKLQDEIIRLQEEAGDGVRLEECEKSLAASRELAEERAEEITTIKRINKNEMRAIEIKLRAAEADAKVVRDIERLELSVGPVWTGDVMQWASCGDKKLGISYADTLRESVALTAKQSEGK